MVGCTAATLLVCMLFKRELHVNLSLAFLVAQNLELYSKVVLNNMYNKGKQEGNGKKEKIGTPIICCCSLFPRGRESSALILTRHCRLINEEKQC